MQSKLEIHINENPISHYVKIIKLIGPRRPDLPPERGFYVRPASGRLLFIRPGRKPMLVLEEGMYLSSDAFRERRGFIIETRAKLNSQRMKTVKVEIEKPTKQKVTRKNTGIQVTISNDPFPVVTHIQALTREELPAAYLNSNLPKVWLFKNKLYTGPDCVLLEMGEDYPYTQEEIADALLYIRLAGEHLAAVNKPKETYPKHRQAATFKDGKLC